MTTVDIGSVPQELWNIIFKQLNTYDLEAISLTCKLFYEILKEYKKIYPNWYDDQFDEYDDRDYYDWPDNSPVETWGCCDSD